MNTNAESRGEPTPETEEPEVDLTTIPSTLPPCGVDLRSFATEEDAQRVGEALNSYLHMIGKCFDLKRLLKVIVAFDYHDTLAGLDRGVEGIQPLMATNDGLGVGIAMTPTVLHEGEARSIIVINAAYASALALPDDGSPELAAQIADIAYTLAHESGHVHDLEIRATNLPGIILRTQLGFRDGILFRCASGCWDEYIASYLSAGFGNAATLKAYEETFVRAVEQTRDVSYAAIRQYRMHADVDRLTKEVSHYYGRLLVYAAYLIGHVEGLKGAIPDLAPLAAGALERNLYMKPFFSELKECLIAMHDGYGKWESLDAYNGLKDLFDRLLQQGGIIVHDRPNGAGYIDVPFSPDTMPSLEDRLAFLAAKNAK